MAPWAPLLLDTLFGNHPSFSPTCAAVLLGALRDQSEGGRNIFFIGAGVSVNPPTHFPTALTIIRRLVEAVAPDDAAREKLLSLADSGRSDKRHPGDYIRFESLLETIRFADPDLSLLEFVNLFDAPNPLHLYLAKQASLGNVVITTNFDNLIEESVLALGHKPLTVCRLTEYDTKIHYTPPEGRVPIYKLHGSYWQYDAGELRPAIETIQATLGTVAAGLTDLILPEAKRSFLSEMTEGSRMIVVGYSGGDDLDIMPAFYDLEPSSLTWLIHDGSLAGMKDITEQMQVTLSEAHEDELPARDLFFKTFMRTRPGLLRIFAGNTMQMLLGDVPWDEAIDKRLPGEDRSTTSFEQFITHWQSQFLDSNHVKLIIVGHLMMRLGRFDEAYQAYVRGHAACDAKNLPERFATTAAMVSRSAAERLSIKAEDKETIAELYAYLAQYHLEKNEPALALESARRSLGLAEASAVKEFIFRAEFMIGLSQHRSGDINDAIGKITRSILSAREHGIRALLLDQIYLCARYNIVSEQPSELAECLKWVMDTYKELGNSARSAQIKKGASISSRCSS